MSVLLPTGTLTLLLADVEGSTRLWETQPEEMSATINRTVRLRDLAHGWTEGTALSTEETIAHAQRGHTNSNPPEHPQLAAARGASSSRASTIW